MSSMIVFFIGAMFVTPHEIPIIYEEDNNTRYDQYKIDSMANFVILLGVIAIIKLIQLILTGGFRSNFDDMEGVMGNGIVGHLLLLSYSLIPILFLYWLDHKRKVKCILAIILILIVTFATFVKYNIIGVIVSLFICTTIYKKSLLKRSLMIMFSTVVAIFVINYAMGFVIRSISVDNSFYLNHFWVYAGGSVINDNGIFTGTVNNDFGVLYRLCIFLFALPNMFIKKFSGGVGVFPHVKKPFLSIGNKYGMQSNVVDAFGYLYPYGKGTFEYVIYYFSIFLLGMIFTSIYVKSKRNSKYFNVFGINFMTYFVFFSFFGTFYINSGPWEILVYSALIPCLFLTETKLRHGKIKIPR